MNGRIHSFQSLGTVDGPGVRAVVFMQGCPLRCVYCHNPDTWDREGGSEVSVDELIRKIIRLRAYFGKNGGLTVSGGEPLLQAGFVTELFKRAHAQGIHCALDTSGCIYNDEVERLLEVCDLVLLDYKFVHEEAYRRNSGCSKAQVDGFLDALQKMNKRVWIRHVVVPGLTDGESVDRVYALREKYSCIEKTELLPFRKLCVEKYKAMGIEFPLADTPEASAELMSALRRE